MKIIQICVVPATDEPCRCLYALTEDGKIYMRSSDDGSWYAVELPEDTGAET